MDRCIMKWNNCVLSIWWIINESKKIIFYWIEGIIKFVKNSMCILKSLIWMIMLFKYVN